MQMKIEEAIIKLLTTYKAAQKLEWINNKVAWSLYKTWEVADKDGKRNEDEMYH